MCWVIPPNSPDTTFAFLKTSRTEVLPWSTCPITVTIGALLFKFSALTSFIFSIISSAFSSLIGLCPNSFTKYSAVSESMVWFMVTVTPIPNKCFIILLDCSAILFASSRIVTTSGILTSLLTGFKLSLSSSWFKSLFSFCFALFNEAKLLPFPVKSSSLSALDTVNFNSLLFEAPFPAFESLLGVVSPFNLLVALCSASFRLSKSELGEVVGLEKVLFLGTKGALPLGLSFDVFGLE